MYRDADPTEVVTAASSGWIGCQGCGSLPRKSGWWEGGNPDGMFKKGRKGEKLASWLSIFSYSVSSWCAFERRVVESRLPRRNVVHRTMARAFADSRRVEQTVERFSAYLQSLRMRLTVN